MAGTNDFIFHRFKGPKSEGGGMREEYRHELSQEILGTRSTQKLKAAEAYFRSTICKSP
jgi:hypothetical protein